MKCTAHKTDGTPCKAWAIKGANVCRVHGGSLKRVKAAAARRVQEQKLRKAAERTLGGPVDVSPTEALLDEIRWTAGHVKWLRERVQDLEEAQLTWGTTRTEQSADDSKTIQTASPSVVYDLYARERTHLVNVTAAALKAGVEERRVRLAEQQGDLITQVIRTALDGIHRRLTTAGMSGALDAAWRDAITTEVPQALRAIGNAQETP